MRVHTYVHIYICTLLQTCTPLLLFKNVVLMSKQFVVHPEVKEALHGHQPIVALETAIVTHGMPHPHNYE